jgi:nucleotide-binding universal stress UspA family protein
MNPIKTILVATDFTDIASHALDYAVDLARALKASIVVVHAYELPVYGFPNGVVVPTTDWATRLGEASQLALDDLMAKRKGTDIPLKPVLRCGDIQEEIERVAEEEKADLIVVGTHGRRGLSRALLGSMAEKIVRTSKRPVLAVHAPNAK